MPEIVRGLKNPLNTGKVGMSATVRFKKAQISALQNRSRSQNLTLLNLPPIFAISSRTGNVNEFALIQ